jgi:hypothetical protein
VDAENHSRGYFRWTDIPVTEHMPIVGKRKACSNCGREFTGPPSVLAKRKYCSKSCYNSKQKELLTQPVIDAGVAKECLACGNTFYVRYNVNNARKYCSRECYRVSHLKSWKAWYQDNKDYKKDLANRPRDENGKILFPKRRKSPKCGRFFTAQGYVNVMVKTLPEEDRVIAEAVLPGRPYVLEHRLVASKKIGRPVQRGEVVHHINGIRDDNRPENLEVISADVHSKQHRDVERDLHRLRIENDELHKTVATLRQLLQSHGVEHGIG